MLTYIGNVNPNQLENKIKEIAKERGIDSFSNYDQSCLFGPDSQGYYVTEHFIEDLETKQRLHVVFKNSYQKDQSFSRNKNLMINND